MEKRKPGRPSNNSSRRNEILQKAAYCFTIKGYDNTTLDEIGDSLGFNKAALYYYFKNKEDLFGHVINYESNRLWEIAKAETDALKDFNSKIIKYLEVRTEIAFIQIKLNELSKSNLIDLNPSYTKALKSFREHEMIYLLDIFALSKSKHNETEIREFINLLISVQTSIIMSTLLLKDISKNISKLPELKSNKIKVFKHLLNSFQH